MHAIGFVIEQLTHGDERLARGASPARPAAPAPSPPGPDSRPPPVERAARRLARRASPAGQVDGCPPSGGSAATAPVSGSLQPHRPGAQHPQPAVDDQHGVLVDRHGARHQPVVHDRHGPAERAGLGGVHVGR